MRLIGVFFIYFGVLGLSLARFGSLWDALGLPWGAHKLLLDPLALPWNPLGLLWGALGILGRPRRPLGQHLDPSWVLLLSLAVICS